MIKRVVITLFCTIPSIFLAYSLMVTAGNKTLGWMDQRTST